MSQSIRERFKRPWAVEEMPSGYRVVDAEGNSIAWVYCEDEQSRRAVLQQPTFAEGLAIARAIAGLNP